ncbi:nonribosomal peptide synthase SidD [Aspergillus fumigatus Af293]|uniref:Nonribosomal peptide synthetase sidD n=2 Tax=Aspergillus fumigatus TaxID=746128 RepID=SIDD_ASPFU|nr:nonribosomal peptide synthase SidD [Aspergillus fumigatus Af293]Q4WF53.1 RecName: Full=Nonribosomal peptide synthase sidD; Short=NPRS sidD; AltName: Full=Siderophore synthetase D [Aspergillus fumigatus Af293]EAL86624.1 nonribosomal peptide synthase SidD [Aspergillus fumigatus Af293]
MGSIQQDDVHNQIDHCNQSDDLPAARLNCNDVELFEVAGLACDETSSPTGMRDEMVLLSWLIALLRTREGGQIRYEWAYRYPEEEPVPRCLAMNEVVAGLQSSVKETAAAVSRHISADVSSPPAPASLLLSTSSLSQTSDEAKDEGLLHLEIAFENGLCKIRPTWHSENMLPFTVTRYARTLIDTVRLCISNCDAAIQDCLRPTAYDLDEIWRWNHNLPPTYNFCMHEIISDQAQKFPDKEAIASWDGSLTYRQIDQYSSFVARSLIGMGVGLHDVLPVCFEKSRWTIVAVLAVMKAGATFVLMDPTLPLARLQNMAQQVGAKMMVSSRGQYNLATEIIPNANVLVVEENTFSSLSAEQNGEPLPTVPSSALMYMIFTSGSTGTPKGVKISHETYTSSAIPRANAVGYTEDSRVLDFASYAFDVSIDSMLLTLGNGGCLCIPSDEDRLNDINGVIRRMKVNYAGLTPSVARILDADVISSLSGLGLGGEAVSARDVNLWGQDTRIIIGYGPCECTIGCTVNSSAATGRDYISIGPGNGAVIWIVDPNDHESLVPLGAVGELLVEGPIVGQGYLNDPEKTAAAFIEDPSWLVAGHEGYPGRRGRLYKTGDLGRYDPDGSGGIVFVGRKDTQVKLRGQRVELGEIESQLRARLPSETTVIAEVIVPQGSGGQPTLVAFVAAQTTKGHDHTGLEAAELPDELRRALSEADAELAKVLPRYMVPTAYIPVNHIPTLISGKTDRKRLRQFGATVDLRQLDQDATNTAARELSDLERRLRQAWSQTLKLQACSIRLQDNFFALGGDSLTAMKLVSVCRSQGLDLSVTSMFSNPTLSAMASVVRICDVDVQRTVPAFSMITSDMNSACVEAAEPCGVGPADIEDIYPCTPTQESLFTFSLKSVKPYVAQRVLCIPSHIDLNAWRKAWEDVVAALPILRTRVAQLQEPGLQQVVLKNSISWTQASDLAEYLENDRTQKMNLGESLARYAIVEDSADGKRYMVWTIHHVLYDGWSEPIILKQVSDALQGQPVEVKAQMRDFVRFVRDSDDAAVQEFWRRELKGAVGPQFPRLPSRDFMPTPDALVERQVSLDTSSGSPFTMATLIRGAWALVASQYTGSDDIVFGETLTGRDIPLPGVESIVGPLIATVPIRVRILRGSTVESYLQAVQQSVLARTPYQHLGMQNIRKVSQDAQHACETGTGLVIQPEPEYVGSELGVERGDVVLEALHFNPYPLMLACGIRKGGFRVCASFDSSLIETRQMERMLAQLETACWQLSQGLSRKVDEISCLPEAELNQIWQWNRSPPLSLDETTSRLRANASTKPGSSYPPAVVPWVCSPRNSSLLSPIGCVGELWLEGALLSGDTVDSPAWLVAGSSTCAGRTGKVQATGDMVQLREDGSLVFVGRKENVVPVQGHAVDITEIERHLAEHLPPTIRAAATVVRSSSDQELVMFIEQPAAEEACIELLSEKREIVCDAPDKAFQTTICATIPGSLAAVLKKLDKYMRDSLPSYMAPSAYIVVEKLPNTMDDIDHNLLNQIASQVTPQILNELRDGLSNAWTKATAPNHLSASESILRSAWAKVLRVDPEQIDVDDNFFRRGGDSVLAMKLVSSLRAQGYSLSVADIFRHMRLSDAARVMKVDERSTEKINSYQPFSMLRLPDVQQFLANIVRPQLGDQHWPIRDVLPVTDSQDMDIRATIQPPRTSIQYTMLYFDNSVDRERLFRSCSDLVKTHEILRTVFISHESSFLQVVLNELEIPVRAHKTDKQLDQYVASLFREDIESNFQLGCPFLRLFYVEGNNGESCLVIGLSHAQYDGVSLPRLLQDLDALYTGTQLATFSPFSLYMAQTSEEAIQNKAAAYWRNLLSSSSLSTLDGPSSDPTDKAIFHTRPVNIHPLKEITTANLLTAAWAMVLARRLQTPDVTFGSVTSGRTLDIPNAENFMGPCYQLTPVRVPFHPDWTASDLLNFVQTQSAESAAHDFLGFEKIAKLAGWASGRQGFDSIVHHQDWEDFDMMPFGGGSCRVDIANPHGDAAYPVKAVSFVKEGEIHVGVVCSERDVMFVDEVLGELAAAVVELAGQSTEVLLDSKLFSGQ